MISSLRGRKSSVSRNSACPGLEQSRQQWLLQCGCQQSSSLHPCHLGQGREDSWALAPARNSLLFFLIKINSVLWNGLNRGVGSKWLLLWPPSPLSPPSAQVLRAAALSLANDIYFLLSASGRALSLALPADVNPAALLC